MKLSNVIEEFIKEMLAENREIELQRNELASRFNCVPSQINYVISTRFSPERGYSVESRRGGGGYIKITRTAPENENLILHIIGAIGSSITAANANAVIQQLFSSGLITHKEAKIIIAALSDSSILISRPERDIVRARIFKNILINLV